MTFCVYFGGSCFSTLVSRLPTANHDRGDVFSWGLSLGFRCARLEVGP